MLIVAVGLGAALWAAVFMSRHGYQDRPPFAEENNIAVHLVLGHGFRSPLNLSASAPPSAWSAPIYPLIIATAYRLYGIRTPAAVTLLMLVNAACFGAAAAAIYALGRNRFHAHAPGLLAALLFAAHPLFLFYAADFWDGMLSLAMFLWVTVGALRIGAAAARDRRITRTQAVGLGTAMGLLLLTNSSYAVTYPIILALAFPRGIVGRRWGSAALTLAVCLIVITPWTIRNVHAFGRLFFVRTGFGLQLWLGNEPVSKGWLDAATYRLHPYGNAAEQQALFALGEPAYNDLCVERFRRRFAENPTEFWRRCLWRTGFLLLGEPTEPVPFPFLPNYRWHGVILDHVALNAAIATLGMLGILAARRLGYHSAGLVALMLGTMLPFIPTSVIDRYALPLRALLLLWAAAGVWMAAVRAGTGAWPAAGER